MFFINKKARWTHRSKLEKISYNFFNLPHFFPEDLKPIYVKLLKIVFEVGNPLP